MGQQPPKPTINKLKAKSRAQRRPAGLYADFDEKCRTHERNEIGDPF